MTAAVEGLADEEDGAAVARRLRPQQIDGEAEGVEDGGALISEAQVVDGAGCDAVLHVVLTGAFGGEIEDGLGDGVAAAGEVAEEGGLAVEGNDGNAVRDGADDGLDHGGESAKLVVLATTGRADLKHDYQSEGFAVGIRLEAEGLRNTVVGEDEVVRLERKDELAGLVADEGGNKDQGGLGFKRGRGRGRRCLGERGTQDADAKAGKQQG